TYTGMTIVIFGELDLNAAAQALAGPLTIDATQGSATVRELASNQLTAATADVTLIGSGATFDLNGFSDTAKSLTFNGGSVTTGLGTLTLGAGGVTTNADSTTATISGNLDFGNNTRTFTIAQGTDPSGVDLSISAVIANAGITKAGAGTMAM